MVDVLVVSDNSALPSLLAAWVADGLLPAHQYSYFLEDLDGSVHSAPNITTTADFLDSTSSTDDLRSLARPRRFDLVVAVDEFALGYAALARQWCDIPGPRPAEVRRVRDKVDMKAWLSARGVRCPQVYDLDEIRHDPQIDALVVKPRSLAGGLGVTILRSREEVEQWLEQWQGTHGSTSPFLEFDEDNVEFEEFIDGDLLHGDGLVTTEGIAHFSISRYTDDLLGYLQGQPIGSVIEADAERPGPHAAFLIKVVEQLSIGPGAFHLEFFERSDGEAVFCELGARLGGGGVRRETAWLYGYDLLLEHLRVQLGLPMAQMPRPALRDQVAGFISFPIRHDLTESLVVETISCPLDEVGGLLLHQQLAPLGTLATGPFFSYTDGLAHFVFGGSSVEVRAAIDLTRRRFRVTLQSMETP